MAGKPKILKYWVACHLTDSQAYNVRAKTQLAGQALLRDRGPENYGPLHQVSVDYMDAYHLLTKVAAEDGLYWEQV